MAPKHIRSTIVISSRAALETSGRLAAYEEHLLAAHRQSLRDAIAGTWMNLDVGVAHYSACEALLLTATEQVEMGRRTGSRVNGTLLGTIARLARSAGVTPWTLIEQLPRFWLRGFDGGDVKHDKLGPKEARVVISEQPLMRFAYFRHGLAGTAEAQLSHFCARAYVRVERFEPKNLSTSYRYQWA